VSAPPGRDLPVGPPDRLWEVDAARTAAIVMMVAYHVGYDVDALAPDVGIDPFSGGWRALQVACGSTFLLVVGVSLVIANGRARARGLAGLALWRRHARRAATVLGAALLVSVATLLALGDEYVRFGILHLIGVAMLIAPALVPLGAWNLILGAGLVAAGLALREVTSDAPGAYVLGFRPAGEAGVDLYPLLPWFGVVVIGLGLGRLLYPGGRRGALARRLPERPPAGVLRATAPGRHALPFYLVHQPVLIPLVAAGLALAGVELDPGGFG
jgi:uncharacterized membrane protein